MAFLRSDTQGSKKMTTSANIDTPLNVGDQAASIRSRIRRLDFQRSIDLLRTSYPLLLVGAAGWMLVTRKYRAGSIALAAFVLQQMWAGMTEKGDQADDQKWKDRELERYALKLERGDYGHYEVIPFR